MIVLTLKVFHMQYLIRPTSDRYIQTLDQASGAVLEENIWGHAPTPENRRAEGAEGGRVWRGGCAPSQKIAPPCRGRIWGGSCDRAYLLLQPKYVGQGRDLGAVAPPRPNVEPRLLWIPPSRYWQNHTVLKFSWNCYQTTCCAISSILSNNIRRWSTA